jgi:hypothetical protein
VHAAGFIAVSRRFHSLARVLGDPYRTNTGPTPSASSLACGRLTHRASYPPACRARPGQDSELLRQITAAGSIDATVIRALQGETDTIRRKALDYAAQEVGCGPGGADLPYIALNETHLARWRGNCLVMFGDPQTRSPARRTSSTGSAHRSLLRSQPRR